MLKLLNREWHNALHNEFEKPYFKHLQTFLSKEYATHIIYPNQEAVFSALEYTPLSKVTVVILGQDPYHEINQAHGLSFSVLPKAKIPKSLQNIFKELYDDIGCDLPSQGYLKDWADQGVLLLNTVLTVREHEANAHSGQGWEQFTDAMIHVLNAQDRPLVFILWGKPAQKKMSMLSNTKHLILTAPHPSPLSAYRGFFGSKPFSQTNAFLKANGLAPIDWSLKQPT